jgi:Caspase domain
MKRRDFLAGGLAIAGALAGRAAHAQPVKRAAIVIGVDKVGDLPRLNAAASGARTVADWLGAEGFAVKRFIDDQNPVRVGDIEPVVRELVERGTLEQLVIYFAGHGFINHSSEIWLLSDARRNGNEAISLTEAREAARSFGVPNVVFISDACRSLADSLQTRNVRGSLMFPNTPLIGPVATEVDKFLATRIGGRVRGWRWDTSSATRSALSPPEPPRSGACSAS